MVGFRDPWDETASGSTARYIVVYRSTSHAADTRHTALGPSRDPVDKASLRQHVARRGQKKNRNLPRPWTRSRAFSMAHFRRSVEISKAL